MNILYFSTALSDEIFNDIQVQCRSFKPTFSGIGFDRNIADGISRIANVQAVSLYPIPSYPKYRKIVQKKATYTQTEYSCFVPGILDFPILKELCYIGSAYRQAKRFLNERKGEAVVILTCGIYRSFLHAAQMLSKRYGIHVYSIVPDLPELMINYRKDYSCLRRFLNRLDIRSSAKYRSVIDGFIFLSPHMNGAVNIFKRPYIVVDGVHNLRELAKIENQRKGKVSGERFVMYAGKISKKFGIDKLIDAFSSADLTDVMLFLCGDGDYVAEVAEKSKNNSRIRYLGLVPHDRVLELEAEAILLIDPRPSEAEYARMSFPSKIIEYMASGTPVLTTNLPCFGDEYLPYQYRFDDETVLGMKRTLEQILSISSEDLEKFGKKAQKFILKEKTIEKQCIRIMDFVCRNEGLRK